jgi:hypothetical protein
MPSASQVENQNLNLNKRSADLSRLTETGESAFSSIFGLQLQPKTRRIIP